MLFLVPTPIGNRGDMTPRAIEVLNQCSLILAEDTRVSKPFLKTYGVEKDFQSFHANNEHQQTPRIIEKLQSGVAIAMVTDAGTPGISDPAFLLVRECRQHKIEVQALPGATAFVPALVSSGLPCDRFFFQGFLPQKKGRQTQCIWLAQLPCTVVLHESPHRLLKCIDELILHFGGERQASFAKEISKFFEKHFNGSLEEIKIQLQSEKIVGEWVICLEGVKN
mgnify:FL=1